MKGFIHLRGLLRKNRAYMIWHVIFSLIEAVMAVYIIQLTATITDLVSAKNTEKFLSMLPMLAVIIVLDLLVFFGGRYMLAVYKGKSTYAVREGMGRKILRSRYSENARYSCGWVLSLYSNHVEMLQEGADILPTLVVQPLTAIIAVIFMVRINLKLFAAAVLLMPLSSFLFDKLMKPVEHKNRDILNAKSELANRARDVVNGFYIVKAYNLQKFFMDRYKDMIHKIVVKERSKDRTDSILLRVGILLRYIPQLIIPLYGGYLTYKGEMSLGDFIAANSIIWYVLLPVEAILNAKKRMTELKPAASDIEKFLKAMEENYDSNIGLYKEHALLMNNVSFGYNDASYVIHGVYLTISRGEQVKILGESGCGKSTLLKLLCGINEDFKGNITLFDEELNGLNNVALRKKIPFIPQHPYIFRGTIKDNITLGRKITEERLMEACSTAGMDDMLSELPEGINTITGTGGVQLSGGQCQRIAIARAIIKDGELFIMDEPTSALDPSTEKTVNEGFKKVTEGKSSLVITHRKSLINKGDRVLCMKEGKLYESESV